VTVEETLYGLAAYAPLEGTDLPWASDPMVSDDYIDVLQGEFDRYFQVLFELDLPELSFETSTARARGAYDELAGLLAAKAAAVYAAVAAFRPMVAVQEAVTVPVTTLRTTLVLLNAVTWANFQAHEAGAWRWAVANRVASIGELRSSAESTYRLWALVRKLHAMGALNALKKPQFKGNAGLGELATGAIIAIAIASVAAIAILAWILVTLKVESNRVSSIEQTCQDEHGRLLANAPPHCAQYFGNIAANPNGHLATMFAPVTEALTAAVKTLATVAGVGVLLYVGAVYVLPAVVGTFRRRAVA
jgi:hypothetical protein